MVHFRKLLFYLGFTLFGCSDGGGGESEKAPLLPDTPRTVDALPSPDQSTDVNFKLFGSVPEYHKNCRTDLDAPSLHTEGLAIDGQFQDWQKQGWQLHDHPGDQRGRVDLLSAKLGMQDERLFLQMTSAQAPDPDQFLYLEFYRGFNSGTANITLEHVIRIHDRGAEIFANEAWSPLPQPFLYSGVRNGAQWEFSLSIEHFLTGIVDAPLWGLQISAGNAPSWSDYFGMSFFQGRVAGGYGHFNFAGCGPDTFSQTPLQYQHILAGTFDKPISLIRFAEGQLETDMGQLIYPITQIPIIGVPSGTLFKRADKNLKAPTIGAQFSPQVITIQGNNDQYGFMGQSGFEVDPFPAVTGFEDVILQFYSIFFQNGRIGINPHIKEVLSYALASAAIRKTSGLEYWLEYIQRENHWRQQLGTLMEEQIGTDMLLIAWQSLTNEGEFWQSLEEAAPLKWKEIDQLQKIFEEMSEKEDHKSDVKEKPSEDTGVVIRNDQLIQFFLDSDRDGAPDFFELQRGTDINQADTDADGWSDFAEIVMNSDPKTKARRPNQLYPDGIFSDFLDLIPGKITQNKEQKLNKCGKAGRIKSYAAVMDAQKIIIALRHDSPREWTEGIRWDIELTIPDKGFVGLIKAHRGESGFRILDADGALVSSYRTAIPLGLDALEISALIADLGIDNPRDNVQIRMSSFLNDEDNHFCDDTEPFSPIRHESLADP